MASIPNPDENEVPTIVGRRSTRLSMIIPIAIKGTSAEGQAFRENTWTIGINKQGARIASFHKLNVGDEIVVSNPLLGHTARARVIRVGEKRFPEDPYEVGVELMESRNVWGVKFPPEDWKGGMAALPSVSRRTPGPSADGRPEMGAAPLDLPAQAGPARAENPPVAPVPTPTPEKSAQFDMAIEALSQLSKETESVGGRTPATEPETRPVQAEAGAEKPASAGKPPAEIAEPVSPQTLGEQPPGLDRQLGTLAEQVRATEQQVEGLVRRLTDFDEGWESKVARACQQAERAAAQAIEASLDEARERLNREADAAASKSLDEARRRLEEEARRSAEAFRETAATVANRVLDEQLAGVAPMLDTLVASSAGRVKDVIDKKVEELEPEFKAASGGAVEKVAASYLERASQAVDEKVGAALNRLHVTLDEALGKRLEEIRREGNRVASEFKAASAQAGEESAKALAKQSADAVAPVTAATDAGRGKLQATVKDLEGDLEGKMTDFRRQMGDSSGVALDGFRNYLGDIARSFEEQLEISARDHQARAAEQTAGDMKKFAADTLDVVKAQCQKQADDFLELFDHQLSTTAQKHVEQVRTQMSELGHSAAEQLQKDSQAREAERALLEAHAKKVLEETSRQLSGVAEGTASSLRQAVREATEGYRDQLHRTLDESVARSTEDLDNYFTNVLEGRRGAVVAEIHKQADEAGARAVAEVKGRAETAAAEMKGRAEAAAKDATDQVLRQVGLATMVLKDWGDQATSRLEGTFQKSLETFKMRIEMIASSAAEDQRKRSTKTTSELLQRLKQAAQALETPSE